MQVKFYAIPAKPSGSLESELNAFLREQRVLTIRKEFVQDGENSFWGICVEYLEAKIGVFPEGAKLPKVDYRERLTQDEFDKFCRIREWRKGTAEQEGIPVYAVLTNEQMARIVQQRVDSKEGLRKVDGVGESRIGKYGEAILQILANTKPR